ncbi:MAG: hypothetical protein PHN75_19395 [Syntrophales bacterium]|nr:hypothetical protein [Syntrophales bacterium]
MNDRNKVIAGRMAMVDLQYLEWLRSINADKQLLDTASDAVTISVSLAASLTGGEMAKSVLSAIAAGVTGIKASVDKNYYYDKTISAMGATMNAQRKTVAVRILAGMNKSLEEYPFGQGLADLYEYYQAGTLLGAVSTIQAEAGVKEKIADDAIKDEQIRMLTKASPEEKAACKTVYDVWENSGDPGLATELPKLYTALKNLGKPGIKEAEDAKAKLHELLQVGSCIKILKELQNVQYPVSKK